MRAAHTVTTLLAIASLVAATPSEAQFVNGWGLGSTWSNMVTADPGGSSRGNTSRRLFTVWISKHLRDRGPVRIDVAAHLVAKGFEVTGPTIHSEWIDVPLTVTLPSRSSGPFFSVGPYLGLRVHCSRSARTVVGRVDEGCGRYQEGPLDWDPVRRWDLGFRADVGLRASSESRGAVMVGAGMSRSLIDLRPEEFGRTRNEVVSLWVAFEGPRR